MDRPSYPRAQTPGPDAGGRQAINRSQITTEQRVWVRETLSRQRVNRIPQSRAGFAVSVGSHVPRRHRLYHLFPAIFAFAPLYRGYDYRGVDDTICIADPETYAVGDVIPADLKVAVSQSRGLARRHVELLRFPAGVIERVPQLDGFRYVIVDDDVVVVDPSDRSVVLVITE